MGCMSSTPEFPSDVHPNLFTVATCDNSGRGADGYLEVTLDEIIFHQRRHDAMHWPLQYVKRYGYDNNIFSFESGRRCESGPGVFIFRCPRAEELFYVLHSSVREARASVEEQLGRMQAPAPLVGRPELFSLPSPYLRPTAPTSVDVEPICPDIRGSGTLVVADATPALPGDADNVSLSPSPCLPSIHVLHSLPSSPANFGSSKASTPLDGSEPTMNFSSPKQLKAGDQKAESCYVNIDSSSVNRSPRSLNGMLDLDSRYLPTRPSSANGRPQKFPSESETIQSVTRPYVNLKSYSQSLCYMTVDVGDIVPLTPKGTLLSLPDKTPWPGSPQCNGSNYASIDLTRTKALHCSTTSRNVDVFVKRTRHDCFADHSR